MASGRVTDGRVHSELVGWIGCEHHYITSFCNLHVYLTLSLLQLTFSEEEEDGRWSVTLLHCCGHVKVSQSLTLAHDIDKITNVQVTKPVRSARRDYLKEGEACHPWLSCMHSKACLHMCGNRQIHATSGLALQWIARSSHLSAESRSLMRRCSTQRHTKITTRVFTKLYTTFLNRYS